VLERLPVVPLRKLVDTLRAWIAAVGRADVVSIQACRVAPADDTSTTTRLADDALSTPVRAGSMVYVLGMAHLAASLVR
jgi:hypothetical protein